MGWGMSQRAPKHNTYVKSLLKLHPYADFCFRIMSLRSSHPEVFCEKGVLWSFAKFTGKQLCQSLLFNKIEGLL